MRELQDGIEVRIDSSQKEWDRYNNGQCPYYAEAFPMVKNTVVRVYQNKEICIVTNTHLSKGGYVYDLLTSDGEKLIGFASWELKKKEL